MNIFELVLLFAVLAVGYLGGRFLDSMYGLLGWIAGFLLRSGIAGGAYVLTSSFHRVGGLSPTLGSIYHVRDSLPLELLWPD